MRINSRIPYTVVHTVQNPMQRRPTLLEYPLHAQTIFRGLDLSSISGAYRRNRLRINNTCLKEADLPPEFQTLWVKEFFFGKSGNRKLPRRKKPLIPQIMDSENRRRACKG